MLPRLYIIPNNLVPLKNDIYFFSFQKSWHILLSILCDENFPLIDNGLALEATKNYLESISMIRLKLFISEERYLSKGL